MKVKRTTFVQASPDAVWNVLGPRYTEAYKWASSIHMSTGRGAPGTGSITGAPCSGRVCETELGQFKENIEIYNEKTREVAYSAQGEKMPFFVKKMLNHWQVESDGQGGSKVSMVLDVNLMFPFNILMALPMRMQLGGVLKFAHEELKYFIENNETPHPRKRESRKKLPASSAVA